ncbi:hypothetical protein BU26DRAFT_550203 [Trematosphaeria pertusa]|uniref:Uncharacterized protein n=1 Tax=Trematosphaeria pertusa TaxID=390896 RepID=A0A6A6II83_9PLEO|nr:uncharacterized protein BU26DRAFT_550203 [Trematosphaeria pertusa]KAF2249887.1 hypothetical protein BU26DRAFT_550203 [Trematosphaeria pertusa]
MEATSKRKSPSPSGTIAAAAPFTAVLAIRKRKKEQLKEWCAGVQETGKCEAMNTEAVAELGIPNNSYSDPQPGESSNDIDIDKQRQCSITNNNSETLALSLPMEGNMALNSSPYEDPNPKTTWALPGDTQPQGNADVDADADKSQFMKEDAGHKAVQDTEGAQQRLRALEQQLSEKDAEIQHLQTRNKILDHTLDILEKERAQKNEELTKLEQSITQGTLMSPEEVERLYHKLQSLEALPEKAQQLEECLSKGNSELLRLQNLSNSLQAQLDAKTRDTDRYLSCVISLEQYLEIVLRDRDSSVQYTHELRKRIRSLEELHRIVMPTSTNSFI